MTGLQLVTDHVVTQRGSQRLGYNWESFTIISLHRRVHNSGHVAYSVHVVHVAYWSPVA